MSSPVLDMLARGRAAPLHISPLDAIMGDDWAIVDFGEGGPTRQQIRRSLMEAHRRDIAPSGTPMPSTVPGYSAQAVVKMVRTGGARDATGFKAQLNYLSRDGDVKLHRSEQFMGIEIGPEEIESMVAGWNMSADGPGKSDRTSHFIVSFPRDTGVMAAERAGRAWAEEMFGSGSYGGDSFDYYTAFHTDRDHPHMHVIVCRRGVDNGTWLKVSKRSDFNYQTMREVAVQVGNAEGIELEATPRLARGAWRRPIPDAEYRRAQAEGREPKAPEHTPVTAARSAAAITHYARSFSAEAKLLERPAPELAKLLRNTAEAIQNGQEVTESFHRSTLKVKALSVVAEHVEAARTETREKFKQMDEGLAEIDDAVTRVRFMRQVATLKAEAAPYMGRDDMADYLRPAEQGRYAGMVARTARESEIKKRADQQVREVAEKYGVNPSATIERYSGSMPSKALADQYGDAEAMERERHRGDHGGRKETAAQRDQALARMHREIVAIYADADATVREVAKPVEGPNQRRETVRSMAATGASQTTGVKATKKAGSEEQKRLDQERRNAERKKLERERRHGL
ncbi:MAG: hypothetical protein EP336_15430 [Rhodobacteraceae bacterium]|nr:MAG: hypothetical protein EP336_15430 [Paracoccaceae bacterium]